MEKFEKTLFLSNQETCQLSLGMGIEKSAWGVLSLNGLGQLRPWWGAPTMPHGVQGRWGGGGKDSQAKKEFGYLGDQFVATQ